jgi:hypothetical protein
VIISFGQLIVIVDHWFDKWFCSCGHGLSGRQKLEHQFANKYFSFGTKVAGICGWSKHVVKWCPFDSIFHNNQFKAEDAFRKNGMII